MNLHRHHLLHTLARPIGPQSGLFARFQLPSKTITRLKIYSTWPTL
jgi:hypothetical protein